MFDISIILINYNSEQYTINCIQSLLEHTSEKLSCEYIVVDNGSEEESYTTIKNHISTLHNTVSITLIRSHINTGFGTGNMIGVQKATGKYLAFINNDTLLENDCLSELKTFMEKHPNVGVCGPQAYNEHKKMLASIDHYASPSKELLGRKILETINPKTYPKRKKLHTQPLKVQFVIGCFMLFRAEDFNAVGGFDTNIFLYYEETDICKRLANIGKSTYLVPNTSFIHYHGASTEHSIIIKTELKISLLYVLRKHYGIFGFYSVLTYLQIRYFFSSLINPKYWYLWYILFLQAPLTKSLKHRQKINPI